MASDTLRVTLSAPAGGTVAEGATGHFEVAVAGSTAAGAVTVRYSVSGTAVSGEDYTALAGEATVAKGESTARIALEALEDGILDKGETVVLALTGATGPGTVIVDGTAATATIADNGTVAVSLTAVPDTISEGSAWRSAVTMSTPVAGRISVRWRTTDGTAVAGRDYTAADEVVLFQPGETSKPISVQTLEDDNAEAVEVFYVSLDPPVDAARSGTGDAVKVDPKPQSAFIGCNVAFPPGIQTVFRFNEPVASGTVIGTVAADTHSLAVYSLGGGGNKFTINVLTGEISTTATLSGGSYPLTVSVLDDCGDSASVDVIVIVNGTPETVGTIPNATIKKGESGKVDASSYFSDPERGTLKYTASSSEPSVVGVSVSGSTVTYEGLKVGSAEVTVTATDVGDLSASQSFTVTVMNSPPGCKPIPSQDIDREEKVKIDLADYCSDKDGDRLRYSGAKSSDTGVATVALSGSELTITGVARGNATISATATDPLGESAKATVLVTVTNTPPECDQIPRQPVDAGKSVTVNLADYCSDKDGDLLSYEDEYSDDEDVATVSLNGSKLKITGVGAGNTDVGAMVSDGNGGSASPSIPVTVIQPNRPPEPVGTIPNKSVNWGETGSVDVTSYFRDLDGDELTYKAASTDSTIVSVGVTGSKVTYTGESVGTAGITVTADDGKGDGTAKQIFDVKVTNREPECRPIPLQKMKAGQSESVDLAELCSDQDPDDRLSYGGEKSTDEGIATVSLKGSVLTIKGVAGGRATVSAVATDLNKASDTASGPVEVEEVNKPPVADAGRDQTVEEGDRVDLDGSDSYDRDGTIEEYAWTQLSGPEVTLYNADKAEPHFRAPGVTSTTDLEFRLKVTDDDRATDTDDVTVTVEPEPVPDCSITSVANGNFTLGEHSTTVGTVGVDASDCGTLDYALGGAGADDVSAAAVNASSDNAAITGNFNFEVRSSYDLTLTVSERGGSASKSGRVRIKVTDENDPPRASGAIGKQRVQVGDPISVNLTGYFTDEDAGDRLTFESKSSATGRLTVNASGSPVTLTGVAAGSATVTVTARDRGGLTATQTFSVTVVPQTTTECRISVSKGALSVPEDAGTGDRVDGKVGVTATGACGTLSYALSGTGSENFTVAAAGSGDDAAKLKVAGKLDHETTASYALKLTVSSGTVSAEGDVGVTVTDVNEAPVIESTIPAQDVVTGKSKSVVVSSHFSDPDGDDLTYLASSSNRNVATVSVNGATVVVRGVAKGSAEVTVTARDPGRLEVSQKFTVTVTDPPPTNGAPKIESAIPAREVVAGESVSVVVSSHFSDPDNDILTYLAESLNETVATVSVNGATVVVQGVAKGSVEVKVTARDPHAEEISQRFSVTVKPANAAPVAATAIPAMTVAAGESKTVDVSAHFRDPDGDALEYEASSSNEAAATVGVEGSELKVTGVLRGESRVTVTARDPKGAQASQSFLVTVPNEAPELVGTIPALILSKGDTGSVRVSAHFSDAESDALTYKASSSNVGVLSVKVAGEHVSYEALKVGTSRVTVTADDGHGGTADQVFGVTVKPENAAPVIVRAMAAITVEADSMEVVDAAPHFRDPDGDELSYEASSSDEAVAKVSASGSEVTVTGVSRGDARVTVTALDGRGGSVPQDFAVTVPNRAPVAVGSIGPVTTYMHGWVTVGVSGAFRDPDGDKLTYRASSSDEGVVTVEMARNVVEIRTVSRGSAKVTVTADDGYGGTDEQEFEVEVPNREPIRLGSIKDRTVARGESFEVGLAEYFRDFDLDKLTYTATAVSKGFASFSVEGAELTVTGVKKGSTRVDVLASDGHGGSAKQYFGLTVTNGAPSFGADGFEREVAENSAAGTAVGDPVAASDADGDAVTHAFVAGGDEALFEIDETSGQITVAAGAAFDYESEKKVYTVHVEASDGKLTATVEVKIRLTDVPAPGRPVAPVVAGGTEQVSVSWSAPTNEGPAITDYDLRYRASSDNEWTELKALGAVSAHTITGLDAGTTYSVQVRAESSEGAGEWSESGEGTTEASNHAPAFGADAYEREVAENSAAGTAVGEPVTATDKDGDDVKYAFVAGGDEASFEIDASSGQLTVAEGAALDYESEKNVYTVHVEASDGTLAARVSVTIRLTDVPAPGRPDAPVVTGGEKEVSVTWSAPPNDGPAITSYDLRYRANEDNKWTKLAALGAVSAHTIAGLDAGTLYEVQVRAESSEGAGKWSKSGEGATEDAPNHAPVFGSHIHEREVAENSAPGTAVGEPVTATDEDGDDLAYSFIASGDETSFEIDEESGQITVATGAALDHEGVKNVYTVHVQASDGELVDATEVKIRVTDVPAPGKPDAPTVTGGEGEVSVSWSAPSNEGPAITGYDLRYRANQDNDWTVLSGLGTISTHKITGLDAGTAYFVQVRAESSEGAGEWSESGEGTTAAANRAPAFSADAYEREVPENSAAGTAVGEPVTATDADVDDLAYGFTTGGAASLFEIDAATARITVAAGTALNYESADTLYMVHVAASDGELADTTSVTIRVTNADDPGEVTLSPAVARVGVELTAMLADEDGVKSAGRTRKWQRSRDGNSWNDIGTGRMYNPVTADAGRWLRMVFTYADGHGPNKRAVSDPVKVLPANAAPKFPAVYEREVPENSPGGTAVGAPVAATDPDGTSPFYSLASGNEDTLFGIDAATGQIRVADGAVLNYESGDTLHVVGVEASDGELADTASVTIRVTDADDPGVVTLSPAVARVGVELTAMLTDEDGARSAGRTRKWQRSRSGSSWNDIASGRKYTPGTNDEGRWLRAVFTYDDGHGKGKRASSEAVEVLPANTAPTFPTALDREVPENSPGGTAVGAPVAATDPDDGASLSYAFVPGGDEALFGIEASTGQITVAEGAVLDYESGNTLYNVKVEASDGELADTASVRIQVTNADDPGKIAVSADVARVGERLAATLMDQDGSKEAGKTRRWQRSGDGGASWTNIAGARTRFYTPAEADAGKHLRAVFAYTDGHGPGKRAESAAVAVVGANTPVVSFGADTYTVAQGASVDVSVLLSPAGSAALSVEVVAGDSKHTATFQPGAGSANVTVGTAGLSASDTVEVRFGDLPDGVAVGVPATTRVVVAAVASDRAAAAVVDNGKPAELEVEFAAAAYTATAGARGTEVTLRISPAADRRVAVPLTAVMDRGVSIPIVPEPVVFEPGDSLAAFTLDIPAEAPSGLMALGFGALPEAVNAGTAASATVRIAARDDGALRDEAFDVGLAVFGRAVAEGARQAVGARIDAVMRPSPGGSAATGSPSGWAGRAAGTLASLAGVSLNPFSAAEIGRRSGAPELPGAREAAVRLLPSVSFATGLGPQSAPGMPRFGLWAEGSAQSFRGEPGVEYDGGLRALTVGADARIGSSALFGVSLMRSDGDLDYGHRSVAGSLGHAINSVHPYLFVQPSAGIGLWAMAGYGGGEVGGDDHRGDTGDASLRMLSGGLNAPLAQQGAFGLALKGDAFTVGMRADDGRREGMASRARALLEASWMIGGLKLATEAGARYDGGDADTGGGAETGASVGYAGRGLDLDLRGRLALGSGRHREWGAALRIAFDPGTRGEGFRLAISPSQGHDRSGVHGLMDGHAFRHIPTDEQGQWRLDAEAGYALKNPEGGGALDSYTRLSAHGGNRAWSLGAGYRVGQTLRLGFEGSRSQLPGQQPDLGLRLALDFTF